MPTSTFINLPGTQVVGVYKYNYNELIIDLNNRNSKINIYKIKN